jgi:hypothetical protein
MRNQSSSLETTRRDDPQSPAASKRKLETRVRTLERENVRLKRVVASQALTIEALREISRGTY